jgi:hypothetical protein
MRANELPGDQIKRVCAHCGCLMIGSIEVIQAGDAWAHAECPPEKVHHPQHYGGDTTYEVIKVIEAWQLGFHLGNTVKYVARADKKGTRLEDLKKARWYLDREIERCRSEKS